MRGYSKLIFISMLATQGLASESLNLADLSLEDLLNLTVTTASKKAQRYQDVPAAIHIITRKEIEDYGYASLEEILDQVPGFAMVENYDWTGITNFSIRGVMSDGNMDNVAVFVNGMNMQSGVTGLASISQVGVPVEAIDRIEIIRGPRSVLYGSGAFFGVINVITNQPVKGTNQNLVQVQGGSANLKNGFARFSKKYSDGRGSYSVNFGKKNYNPIDRDHSDFTGAARGNAFLNSKEYIADNRMYADFSGQFEKVKVDASVSQTQRGTLYALLPDSPQTVESTRNHFRLTYSDKVNGNWRYDISSMLMSNELSLDYHFAAFPNSFGYSTMASKGYTHELIGHYKSDDGKREATFGYVMEAFKKAENNFDIPIILAYRARLNVKNHGSHGFFFKGSQKFFNEKLSIHPGVRFEKSQNRLVTYQSRDAAGNIDNDSNGKYDSGLKIYPQLGVIFTPYESQVFKLMYSEGYRDPSNLSLITDLLEEGTIDLEKSEVRSLEFNYVGALSKLLSLNSSLYYSNIEGIVSRTAFGGSSGATYLTRNSGELTTKGIELGVKTDINKFSASIDVAYQDTENDEGSEKGISRAFSPSYIVKSKYIYRFPWQLSTSLSVNYVSSMETSWDAQNSKREADKVSSYTRLDLNIRKKSLILNKDYFALTVKNLLDHKFYYPSNKNSAVSGITKGFPAAPRIIMGSYGLKF